MSSTATRLLLAALAVGTWCAPFATAQDKKLKDVPVAVIVNEKNPVKNISFNDLRALLRMERQFWPHKKRCILFLPRSGSPESKVLLDTIYKMTHRKLQRYWVQRLFSGEIPAKPTYVPNAKAAGSRVRKSVGGLSVVKLSEVPKGVRVLSIDGKKPGDAGYPLVHKPKPKP